MSALDVDDPARAELVSALDVDGAFWCLEDGRHPPARLEAFLRFFAVLVEGWSCDDATLQECRAWLSVRAHLLHVADMVARARALQGAGGGEAPRSKPLDSTSSTPASCSPVAPPRVLENPPVPSQASPVLYRCDPCAVAFPTREGLDAHIAYWHDLPRPSGAA